MRQTECMTVNPITVPLQLHATVFWMGFCFVVVTLYICIIHLQIYFIKLFIELAFSGSYLVSFERAFSKRRGTSMKSVVCCSFA